MLTKSLEQLFQNHTVQMIIIVVFVILLIVAFFVGLRYIAKAAIVLTHPKKYEDMNDEERLEYLQKKETPVMVSFSDDKDPKQHFIVFSAEKKIVALGRVYNFSQFKGVKTDEWKEKTGKMVDMSRDNVFYVDPKNGSVRGKMEKEVLHQKIILSFEDTVRPMVTYEFRDQSDFYLDILDLLRDNKLMK